MRITQLKLSCRLSQRADSARYCHEFVLIDATNEDIRAFIANHEGMMRSERSVPLESMWRDCKGGDFVSGRVFIMGRQQSR